MKSCNWVITALCTTLAIAADVARSADVTVRTPHTAATIAAADLITRAERAVAGYIAACEARDVQGLIRVTTDDVRIEYALDEPGISVTVDADSLMANCTEAPAASARSDVADLWIFPTHDPSAVFVHYDAAKGSAASALHLQLALVEMRGDRISRMLNYAGAPPSLAAKVVGQATSQSPCLTQASQARPRVNQPTDRKCGQ